MLTIHMQLADNLLTKPMECSNCGYKRAFDVPEMAYVRTSRRGKPPPEISADMAIIKCRKCGHPIGVSIG